MEILAIIPARGGSKGIPMKNIVKLNGKPLLQYSITSSLNSKLISRTIVSTNNRKIERISRNLGAEVIKRPKILATNKIQMEPAIFHVLKKLKKNEGYKPEIIIVLPVTSPLRTNKHIDDALKLFLNNNYDSMFSGTISHHFFWKKRNQYVLPQNYNPKKRPNRQEMKDQFIENGAIHITKYTSLMKSGARLSGKIGIYLMPSKISFEIDDYLDLLLAKLILEKKI